MKNKGKIETLKEKEKIERNEERKIMMKIEKRKEMEWNGIKIDQKVGLHHYHLT